MNIDKYWAKRSIPEPNTGCWLWELSLFSDDTYGQVTVNNKVQLAHRYSYVYHKGPIPDGMLVRHLCDQPSCVNPDHLILGTHQDNSDDMKRRRRSLVGELNHAAILSSEDIAIIRSDIRYQKDIAKDYNVSRGTISAIKVGRTWTYINN